MSLFPGILARNWQLKLSAFALAVLLWTVLRFEAPSRTTLENVPVRVQLNDPEWALRGDPLPATVRVTLSGSARDLLAVDRPSILVPVDSVVASDMAVLLRVPWLRLPDREGLVVESIEPGSVGLSFERMEVGGLPLAARLEGSLPAGFSLARPPRVTPAMARISGPARRLEEMDSLYLSPLELSGLRTSGVFTLPVDSTGLAGMAISPLEASVEIWLEETLERSLPEQTVVAPTLPSDPQLQVRPALVSVTIRGARSIVAGIDPLGLQVVLPRDRVLTLSPGEERVVPVEILGLPPLVSVQLRPDWVLVRRPAGS